MTVISVFHDREAYVADSVASLARQTEPGARVVLVDDHSADGTLAALRAAAAPDHEVVANPTNLGLVGTLRREVARSTTPFVAIHGSGDLSAPERLRLQADLLEADDGLVAVGCLYRSENLLDGSASGPRALEGWGDRRRIDDAAPLLVRRNLFTHGEVMFRRSAYEAAGGYRIAFVYSQDRDLWLRLSRLGAFALVDEDLYVRRTLPGGVSASQLKRAQQLLLSDLAVACHHQRLEGGRDLVDQLGPLAVAAFRSRASAQRVRRLALRAALADRAETQRLALDLAASLHSPVLARLQWAATWPLRSVPASSRALRWLASRVLPGDTRGWDVSHA